MSHGGDDGLPEEHEEHVNHEAWVIPYADLLTLLMAMFIALFAMSSVDIDKFKQLAIGFNEALGGGDLNSGIGGSEEKASPAFGNGAGTGPFQGGTLEPGENTGADTDLAQVLSALTEREALISQKAAQAATLNDVKRAIEEAAKQGGFGTNLRLELQNRGLVVTLVTDKVVFDSGSATLQPRGEDLLRLVVRALRNIDNDILIVGHTDSDPIGPGGPFPTNMSLSLGRANAVWDLFVREGLDPQKLSPSGRADLDPVAPNTTPEGKAKNRRVEIIVQSKVIKKVQEDAGLDEKPATVTPTTAPIGPPATTGVESPVPKLGEEAVGP
jgi:chemotaxis protein MotB